MLKRYPRGALLLLICALLQACVIPGMDNNITPPAPTADDVMLQASPTQEMHAALEATSTPGITPIPVVINVSNAALLQVAVQSKMMNHPSRLKWISDGELIGVMDSENLNFLNVNTLQSETSAVMQPPIILLDFSSDGQTMLTTKDRIML
ncbi:MAG: hypothetical protein MUO76_12050, partial [Anaerolineaceae bacterium]|nr:hypothetical protein [Anaerolineaceae bacterium]